MATPAKLAKPVRPSFTAMDQTLVMLNIGPDRKPYGVHRELLAKESEYFRALFKGSFREAEEMESSLPDTQPRTFELFLDWLYFRHFPWENKDPDSEERQEIEQDTLNLYIMGDCYNIPKLRHDALSHFFLIFGQDADRALALSTITTAFTKLTHKSEMCLLIVDLFCARISLTDLNDARSSFPVDFMFEVMQRFQNLMERTSVSNVVQERMIELGKKSGQLPYHVHNTAETIEGCQYQGTPRTRILEALSN